MALQVLVFIFVIGAGASSTTVLDTDLTGSTCQKIANEAAESAGTSALLQVRAKVPSDKIQHQRHCTPGGEPSSPLVSGCFKLSNRAFWVSVPAGAGPFPVTLVLHGNGEIGGEFLPRFIHNLTVLTTTQILVAPDGPPRSWNNIPSWNIVGAESSEEDDALYVGTTLVNHLVKASNVKPEFTLFGHSFGAALVNRILIENDDARIVAAITDVSQLNTHQYHDGSFYIGGSDNSYTTVKSALTKRKVLQLTGASDTVCPAAGGEATFPANLMNPAWSGQLKFLAWQESTYVLAKAYGFTGARATATDDSTGEIQRVSYSDVHVSASNYKQAGHTAEGVAMGHGASEVLAFFEREGGIYKALIKRTGHREGGSL